MIEKLRVRSLAIEITAADTRPTAPDTKMRCPPCKGTSRGATLLLPALKWRHYGDFLPISQRVIKTDHGSVYRDPDTIIPFA